MGNPSITYTFSSKCMTDLLSRKKGTRTFDRRMVDRRTVDRPDGWSPFYISGRLIAYYQKGTVDRRGQLIAYSNNLLRNLNKIIFFIFFIKEVNYC